MPTKPGGVYSIAASTSGHLVRADVDSYAFILAGGVESAVVRLGRVAVAVREYPDFPAVTFEPLLEEYATGKSSHAEAQAEILCDGLLAADITDAAGPRPEARCLIISASAYHDAHYLLVRAVSDAHVHRFGAVQTLVPGAKCGPDAMLRSYGLEMDARIVYLRIIFSSRHP